MQSKNTINSKKSEYPVTIAITGGAGSGKTIVCNILRNFGLKVINLDFLSREAVLPGSEGLKKVVRKFGNGILKQNGKLDRKNLRKVIINDAVARKALEEIIHPEILKLMKKIISEAAEDGDSIVFIEVPLLFENNLVDDFDIIVSVIADRQIRIKRIISRDNVTFDDAENIVSIQVSDETKVKHSDFIINNDVSIDEVEESVNIFYKKLCSYIKKLDKTEGTIL